MVEVREYGKKELHELLTSNNVISVHYRTFISRIKSLLEYSGNKLEDFNRRKVLYPKEVKELKELYFG